MATCLKTCANSLSILTAIFQVDMG